MRTVALTALLVLAGCTTYKPMGFAGGFREVQLAQNAYRIETRGNAFASAEKVSEMAVVRAAELAQQRGFRSFIVMDSEDYEQQGSAVMGSGTYSSNTAVYGNLFGATAVTSGAYTPPPTFNYSKPRTSLVVRMFRSGEPGAQNGLESAEVLRTLGPRVGYQPPTVPVLANASAVMPVAPGGSPASAPPVTDRPVMPVSVSVAPARATDVATPSSVATSQDGRVRLTLPLGWAVSPPPAALAHVQIHARHAEFGSFLIVTTDNRADIVDMHQYGETLRSGVVARLSGAQGTEVGRINVKGRSAIRFTVIGVAGGVRLRYMLTAIEFGDQILKLTTWATESAFSPHALEFEALSDGLSTGSARVAQAR